VIPEFTGPYENGHWNLSEILDCINLLGRCEITRTKTSVLFYKLSPPCRKKQQKNPHNIYILCEKGKASKSSSSSKISTGKSLDIPGVEKSSFTIWGGVALGIYSKTKKEVIYTRPGEIYTEN